MLSGMQKYTPESNETRPDTIYRKIRKFILLTSYRFDFLSVNFLSVDFHPSDLLTADFFVLLTFLTVDLCSFDASF